MNKCRVYINVKKVDEADNQIYIRLFEKKNGNSVINERGQQKSLQLQRHLSHPIMILQVNTWRPAIGTW